MSEQLQDERLEAELRKRRNGRIVLTIYLVIILSLTVTVCVIGLNAMKFHRANSKAPTTQPYEHNTNK